MSTIKTLFNAFVQDIRSYEGTATPQQIEQWATQLMEFQTALNDKSLQEVVNHLGVEEQRVFTLLGLGKDNASSVDDYKVVLDIIANHPDQSGGIAVVEFLKSPEGFALMNNPSAKVDQMLNGTHGKQAKGALETFFGGAFGLELTEQVLKSIKAEEIGTLLTYALSGNYETDRIEYNKNPKENPLAFILRKAKAADVEFALSTTTNKSFQTVEGRVTKQNRTNSNGVRGRLRPDHFVSNFSTKQTYLTNTTTHLDKSEQGVSFLNYYLAAVRYTKTKVVNGRNNPLYGHSIHASYLSSGLFPQDGEEENGVARDFVKYINQSNLTSREKRDVAQMEFLGLLGNCSTQEHAAILFAHNPVIAGCDTLDLYWLSLKVGDCLKRGDQNGCNDLIVSTIAKKLKSVAENATRMLESNVLSGHLDNGRYLDTNTHFHYLLTNITNVVDKLPKVFDMSNHIALKGSLLESLHNLVNAADQSGVSTLGSVVETLSDRLDAFANRPLNCPAPRPSQMTGVFDLMQAPNYVSNVHTREFAPIASVSEVDFHQVAQDFFGAYDQLDDLTPKGQFKAAFQEYISSLIAHQKHSDILCVENNAGVRLWDENKYSSAEGERAAFGSVRSLTNTANKFALDLERAGYPLMGEFVRKTKFLLGVDNDDAQINLTEVNQKSAHDFVDFINRLYAQNAPDVVGQYKKKM